MKRKIKDFLSSFCLTLTIVLCIFGAIIGITKAYENTVYIAFGEEKTAIAFTDDGLRILDFEIKL